MRAAMTGCVVSVLLQPIAIPRRAQGQTPALLATTPPAQPARARSTFDPELRVDAIIARVSAGQAGLGITAVTGTYLRSGIVGALGFSRHGLSGRIDGMTRFHFDPFRQSRWAPYAGGGISGRFDRGEAAHAFVLLLIGLDGPVNRGMTLSFEAGLGGGARVGVILRRAAAERR